MENLITGFRLQVTAKELDDHCHARAIHHKQRSEELKFQIPALEKIAQSVAVTEHATEISNITKSNYNGSINDLVTTLKREQQERHNKALMFEFYANHLFAQDYDLTDADLIRLEIIKR